MNAINEYLQTTLGNATSNVTDMLFQWLVVPTIIFFVLFLGVYIWRAVHRHKVDAAILEIRDTLREMKAPSVPETTKPLPPEK